MLLVNAHNPVPRDRSSLKSLVNSERPRIRETEFNGFLKFFSALIINNQFLVNHITAWEKENRSSGASKNNLT